MKLFRLTAPVHNAAFDPAIKHGLQAIETFPVGQEFGVSSSSNGANVLLLVNGFATVQIVDRIRDVSTIASFVRNAAPHNPETFLQLLVNEFNTRYYAGDLANRVLDIMIKDGSIDHDLLKETIATAISELETDNG